MDISLQHYLAVAAMLFTIGVFGIFVNRKNVIIILMSVELIAKGVSRPEDLATLIELGVDGLTGPAVTP